MKDENYDTLMHNEIDDGVYRTTCVTSYAVDVDVVLS